MLIYVNELTKFIYAYHQTISKEDAQEHINNIDCFWIDDLVIEYPPHEENQNVIMYLNENNTIRYEIVEAQEPIVTDDELIQQRFTDIELQNLEGQLERQMLAQQISDLELIMLGGMR